MRFAIRDDDTNYFTTPERLESAYAGLWGRHPISLAVVPFHGCTRSGAVPADRRAGEGTFPLHHNRALVAWLRARVRDGSVSILLHGFDHVDRAGAPEFSVRAPAEALRRRIASGRDYLTDLLETPVRVFVPPHNALSAAALRALDALPMDVLGTFSFRPGRRRPSARTLAPMLRRRLFLWRCRRRGWGGTFYPFPLRVGAHAELGCHGLNHDPSCSLDALRSRLDQTDLAGGDFCLAAHHWELSDPVLAGWLRRVVEHAESLGARSVHAGRLFEEPAVPAGRRIAA